MQPTFQPWCFVRYSAVVSPVWMEGEFLEGLLQILKQITNWWPTGQIWPINIFCLIVFKKKCISSQYLTKIFHKNFGYWLLSEINIFQAYISAWQQPAPFRGHNLSSFPQPPPRWLSANPCSDTIVFLMFFLDRARFSIQLLAWPLLCLK